jgi:hypothetical protein
VPCRTGSQGEHVALGLTLVYPDTVAAIPRVPLRCFGFCALLDRRATRCLVSPPAAARTTAWSGWPALKAGGSSIIISWVSAPKATSFEGKNGARLTSQHAARTACG